MYVASEKEVTGIIKKKKVNKNKKSSCFYVTGIYHVVQPTQMNLLTKLCTHQLKFV